jgi:WD40 repeat protein
MEIDRTVSYVFSAAFTPDGRYALSGSLDATIAVWDIKNGKKMNSLDPHFVKSIGVHTLTFSADGKYLLMGAKGGGEVGLWDAETWKEIRGLNGHTFTECIEDFAFSPDGKHILTGGSYSIKRWDLNTGKEIREITHASFFDRNQSMALAFSPDQRFAFLKGIGFFSLWDVTSGRRLWIYGDNTGGTRWRGGAAIYANSVKFSPGGQYVLSGEDTVLKLRDARTGYILKTFVDEGTGQIDVVTFSPDGKYAAAGSQDGKIRLWDVQSGAKIRTFTGHSDEISGLAFSPDGRKIISSADASARLWDVATGEEIAAMMAFDEKEWLVITPEGYYNSSENGAQYLNVIAGEARYGVDKFYDVFYRPDIVAAKLRGEDIQKLVTISMGDAIKSPPPIVEITSTDETAQPKVKVCYRVKSEGGGIGEIRLFHNGKLVQSDGYYRETARAAEKTSLASLDSKAIYEDMRSVTIKGKAQTAALIAKSKGKSFNDCKELDAVPGDNEISIAAFNATNTVQSYLKTVSFKSKAKFEEPRLFIIAIGIDRYRDAGINLKYAAKDAADILEKLKTGAATLYQTVNIHGILLTDTEAAKANIIRKIDELAQTINPRDSFVLFAAGHGVLLQNQYHLLTSDYSGAIAGESMISSNEIVEASKKIKALTQLFIFDTCHAGGVDYIVSGLYDARMSVLARKMGLHIYASANDKQSAMDGYKGNGLFTYTLLDGLNNNRNADRNGDGKVTIVGLGEYSKRMTTNISRELGHAQTPLIINFGKDSVLYQIK